MMRLRKVGSGEVCMYIENRYVCCLSFSRRLGMSICRSLICFDSAPGGPSLVVSPLA